jgi:Na+-translocating ferredoxin:NAD+ oxidoreductase RNF subunit RnfB
MLRILTRICEGHGTEQDLELLETLAPTVKAASLCGLGGSAPNPVLTALKYFRSEFEAHVRERRCPAGVCKALITLHIDETICKGCGQCVKVCAAGAISGKRKQPHRINSELCTSCSACRQVCTTDAIVVE